MDPGGSREQVKKSLAGACADILSKNLSSHAAVKIQWPGTSIQMPEIALDTASLAYKRAFETYLRNGTPVALSLKQARPTTHYIWRTRGDGKVRPSHAANDGKIFAWDDPPPTGHPGEDYGCRCTAEPFVPALNEHVDITFSGVSDAGAPWSTWDFVQHYLFGEGRDVRVRDTGHLRAIVAEYQSIVVADHRRLPSQIASAARQNMGGAFSYDFEAPYRMTGVVFSIGSTVIGGVARGTSFLKHGILTMSGTFAFYLEDAFRDAADLFNVFPGQNLDVPGARPYRIYDTWRGRFRGKVYADASLSRFVPQKSE